MLTFVHMHQHQPTSIVINKCTCCQDSDVQVQDQDFEFQDQDSQVQKPKAQLHNWLVEKHHYSRNRVMCSHENDDLLIKIKLVNIQWFNNQHTQQRLVNKALYVDRELQTFVVIYQR